MDKPLVSIIILTYKKFDYINECLESVFRQNYSNIELIISDDGSENFNNYNIMQFIEDNRLANITNIIVNKHDVNVGTVRNFNDGIRISSGKYIVPLAADDMFYSENSISTIVQYFEKNNNMILVSYRKIFDKSMTQYIGMRPNNTELKKIRQEANQQFISLCKESFISGAGTSYSKLFFEKFGYFDENYLLAEDYPTFLRATRDGIKIHFLDEIIIKYRTDGISTQAHVHPLLDKDLKNAIDREILPYRNRIGSWLYKVKKFELEKYKIEVNKNKASCAFKITFLVLRSLDITIYKMFYKLWLKFK